MFIHPLNNLGQFFSHSLIRLLVCTSHIIIGPLADVQSILRTDCTHTPTTKNAPKILLIYRYLRNGVLFLNSVIFQALYRKMRNLFDAVQHLINVDFFCESRVWWQVGILSLSFDKTDLMLQRTFNVTSIIQHWIMQIQWSRTGTTSTLSIETTGSKIQVSPILTHCYRT